MMLIRNAHIQWDEIKGYIANKYIYGSKELAIKNGFSEQIEEFLKTNDESEE